MDYDIMYDAINTAYSHCMSIGNGNQTVSVQTQKVMKYFHDNPSAESFLIPCEFILSNLMYKATLEIFRDGNFNFRLKNYKAKQIAPMRN